jgi:SAM-dependent methyltransferase
MATGWSKTGVSGSDYDARFSQLERAGHDMHGEADFVASFDIHSVLDAGCGTGRVAIELARRGFDVVGVDRDPSMLRAAFEKAPELQWHLADLATLVVPVVDGDQGERRFDAIIMAGNVMLFVDKGTEAAVIRNMARHLQTGGLLITGFQLNTGEIHLTDYDQFASQAHLQLLERWSTWDRQPWDPSSQYAVSVHQRSHASILR